MTEKTKKKTEKKKLLIAVVQAQDAEAAEEALLEKEIKVTRLPSTGGFLGRRNATLLIGVSAEQQKIAMDVLKKICRERTEYIAVPLESAPLPIPTPTPITIGGATVFILEVENFEEV
jgi:uncharacterized protein YaaQ